MTKETAAGSSPDNGCLEFTPSSSSCSSRNSSWKLCGRDAIPIGARSLAADSLDAALNFDEAMKKCYQHCPVWGEQLDNVLGHVYEQRCGVEMVGHVMYAGGAEGADTDRTVATAYREHQRVHNCPQGGFQPEGKGELHPMCNCLSSETAPSISRQVTLEAKSDGLCRPESCAQRPLVTDRPGLESQPRSGHSRN